MGLCVRFEWVNLRELRYYCFVGEGGMLRNCRPSGHRLPAFNWNSGVLEF